MVASPSPIAELQRVFPGDGEMAQRCRAFDWASSSLGPPERWSPALRTAVRTALEAPFPINLWCGPELVLIYNDDYRVVLGSKHPSALGSPGATVWREIWSEIAPLFDRIRVAGRTTFAEDAHFLMEREDGPPGEAWFTFSLSPVRDEAGEIVAFLNLATETTRRLLAEREMHAARAEAEHAESRLRTVFAQAPAFLAVVRGEEHVFEFANTAYQQLVGQRDIVGRTVDEVLPEVREQGFIDLLDRVYHTGEPFLGREIPVRLQHTPGGPVEEVYLDFVYQPLTAESGERLGIVVHGTDVTKAVIARREVERLLRESEQARAEAEASEARYRFLANAIPVQVWTATPEGEIDYVSERTASLLGHSASSLIEAGWPSVVHPDDVAATTERWERSLRTGEPYEVEFRLRTDAERSYRWHLGRAYAQRDANGAILRWFGTNTDIEDRKRAEAELQRLTQEALEANRAKSDFLAAMSHDLRTPLNAIGGYAQLLDMGIRGPVTEEQHADLQRIMRSKNHLDRLVSDVLNFAKLGAGRIELSIQPLDVEEMLASVVEMTGPQLLEHTLTLSPLVVTPESKVLADADKTRQILLNLLTNAIKFTPSEGTIAVTAQDTDAQVAIEVRDTGIGIPEEQLGRIFEPFAQAKRALRAEEQGVGLGLAISRQLARAMGGDLTARSVLGAGSTFVLTLPRVS